MVQLNRSELITSIWPTAAQIFVASLAFVTGILCSTLTIDEHGQELSEAVCGLDLEGITAKRKADPYRPETAWHKIKNPTYTQAEGRRELFERRSSNDFQHSAKSQLGGQHGVPF